MEILHAIMLPAHSDTASTHLVARENDGTGKIKDLVLAAAKQNLLPLHYACQSKASIEVIAKLLISYPEGAREKDLGGQLPVHIALTSNASAEIRDNKTLYLSVPLPLLYCQQTRLVRS